MSRALQRLSRQRRANVALSRLALALVMNENGGRMSDPRPDQQRVLDRLAQIKLNRALGLDDDATAPATGSDDRPLDESDDELALELKRRAVDVSSSRSHRGRD